jgi:bis(5'-nucleosyl)-tetraphosphatase (symmetrical)
MSTYVIGDVQGCFTQLEALMAKVRFRPKKDRLWFAGDLINRGAESLDTLRFVKKLGSSAVAVLGNHELHFLAIVFGGHTSHGSDTFHDVLNAADCMELAHWLRTLPLMHRGNGFVMVHAGIPHVWGLSDACNYAREVEDVIAGDDYDTFFEKMYGNDPTLWSTSLCGMSRYRIITNYFTRMRLVSSVGEMEFSLKGALEDVPSGFDPWFKYKPKVQETILFGHWAAIDGVTGSDQMIGLDTGCVWGRCLTAFRLEDRKYWSVNCASPGKGVDTD